MSDEFLQIAFDHILAKDVVKKLMQVSQVCVKLCNKNYLLKLVLNVQVSETMAHNGNGHITSNGHDEDDKPMLLIKKSIDSQGNGLTALINKQLQGECNEPS